eukprot:4199694-Pleurochrysis_carterae.AAC.2
MADLLVALEREGASTRTRRVALPVLSKPHYVHTIACRPRRSWDCLVEPHGLDRERALVTLINRYQWIVARLGYAPGFASAGQSDDRALVRFVSFAHTGDLRGSTRLGRPERIRCTSAARQRDAHLISLRVHDVAVSQSALWRCFSPPIIPRATARREASARTSMLGKFAFTSRLGSRWGSV